MSIPEPTNHVESLLFVFGQLHPVPKEMALFFEKSCYNSSFKKGKHLLRTGEICRHMFFVKKGVVRGYLKEGNREITTWITAENEMVTVVSSFDFQQPSIMNMQALEDCELLTIGYEDLQNLYNNSPEFNVIARKMLLKYYRDAEARALIARLSNAETKYRHFLELHPNLATRVPLKYIASYLGINFETLSRVRKRWAVKKLTIEN